jgi:hypothetical protein
LFTCNSFLILPPSYIKCCSFVAYYSFQLSKANESAAAAATFISSSSMNGTLENYISPMLYFPFSSAAFAHTQAIECV